MPDTITAPYLVTLARDHTLKLHRATCKKALANTAATATDDFHVSLGGKTATPATCCKPRPVDPPATTPAPADVPDVEPEPATVPDALPTYDPHPGRRAELAMDEGRARRKAKRDGTTLPHTPNLDKVNAEYAAGIDAVARRRLVAEYEAEHGRPAGTTGRVAKAPRAPKLDVRVRFIRNGRPMTDAQNKLASVAYFHTKGIDGDTPRCSTAMLRQILADAGVAAPEAEPWGPVTLPNGVVLSAVAL